MINDWMEKKLDYLSKLPSEKRWNAAKHYIFLGAITPCKRCKTHACSRRNSENLCLLETSIYSGAIKELEKEVENIYPKLQVNCFGVQFLIRQIATNMVRLHRAYFTECQEGISSSYLFRKPDPNLYPEYIRSLINQTIRLLKELGLTPMQQLQKEALIISKSLEMRVSKIYINSAQTQLQKSETELQEKKPRKKEQPIKV